MARGAGAAESPVARRRLVRSDVCRVTAGFLLPGVAGRSRGARTSLAST